MNISLDLIKKLRLATSAGIADCRQALVDSGGDFAKAKKLLVSRGLEKAAKKEGKETAAGIVEAYVHTTARVGVLVELRCETDFVARTDDFKHLAHELALQVAAMDPKDVAALLAEEDIRDAAVSVDSMVKSGIAKVGENIAVARFIRFEIGN